jgi:diguanylate cyclase (GGDEF)-like protein
MSMAQDENDGEAPRLEALARFDVLDTEPEEAFDRITRLVRTLLGTPMALVSLIDRDRQWFKSRLGFNASETPREVSFCTHAIRHQHTLLVRDAQTDPRFVQSPLVVGEPYVRFYAGAPLRTRDGHNIGTLCAMDTKVRDLNPAQIRALEDLARIAIDELELRRLASVDSLTGALTRRSFYERAQRDIEQRGANGRSLSCAIIDVDNFKAVNEAHGHAAGDLLLQYVVSTCMAALRGAEYLGRIGGDKFALVLPDTLLLDAFEFCDRLRKKIAAPVIEVAGRRLLASVSIGIAELAGPGSGVDGLLRNADAALHDAKTDGKDRVACHLADLKLASGAGFELSSLAAAMADADWREVAAD